MPSRSAPQGYITCTNCGSESPLSYVLETDECPSCGEAIDPDAPARIRSELVDDAGWDKVHGDDYEPIGGTDFAADEVSEPDRDVAAITETLVDVGRSDKVAVEIGAAEAYSKAVFLVVTHERDVAGFDHRIHLIEKPRDDGWTRLYTTGIGAPDLDPWEVVSAPYEIGTGTADMRDFAANGWLIDVECTDKELSPVPRNPDRDVDDRRPRTDGGQPAEVSEAERFQTAVDDAVAAVREGDREMVASDWAAEKHNVEHRFEDVREAVQEAIEDDG